MHEVKIGKNGGFRSGGRGSIWRLAAWAIAGLMLVLQFLTGAPWSMGDYIFAGALLFGALGALEIAVRMTGNTTYRAAVGVALAAMLILVWANAAVGITDSDADLMYFLLVPSVGILGTLLARFEARGMARAMFATALTQAGIALSALIAGIVPPFNSVFEVMGITVFFVTLFVGSGLLFRVAAGGGAERAAV